MKIFNDSLHLYRQLLQSQAVLICFVSLPLISFWRLHNLAKMTTSMTLDSMIDMAIGDAGTVNFKIMKTLLHCMSTKWVALNNPFYTHSCSSLLFHARRRLHSFIHIRLLRTVKPQLYTKIKQSAVIMIALGGDKQTSIGCWSWYCCYISDIFHLLCTWHWLCFVFK